MDTDVDNTVLSKALQVEFGLMHAAEVAFCVRRGVKDMDTSPKVSWAVLLQREVVPLGHFVSNEVAFLEEQFRKASPSHRRMKGGRKWREIW